MPTFQNWNASLNLYDQHVYKLFSIFDKYRIQKQTKHKQKLFTTCLHHNNTTFETI